MTKTLRKPVTMLLALCMVFSLAVGACADDITSSGGSATSPVNLTTTNEGIGGGEGGEGGSQRVDDGRGQSELRRREKLVAEERGEAEDERLGDDAGVRRQQGLG